MTVGTKRAKSEEPKPEPKIEKEVPTVHMYSPDVLIKWKHVIVRQAVYEDCVASHQTNVAFFKECAEGRSITGAMSRNENQAVAAASKTIERAENRIDSLKKKVEQKQAKAKAKASTTGSTPTTSSGASSSSGPPKVQYERLDNESLKVLIKSKGAEPRGKLKADLVAQLTELLG